MAKLNNICQGKAGNKRIAYSSCSSSSYWNVPIKWNARGTCYCFLLLRYIIHLFPTIIWIPFTLFTRSHHCFFAPVCTVEEKGFLGIVYDLNYVSFSSTHCWTFYICVWSFIWQMLCQCLHLRTMSCLELIHRVPWYMNSHTKYEDCTINGSRDIVQQLLMGKQRSSDDLDKLGQGPWGKNPFKGPHGWTPTPNMKTAQ